MPTTPKIAIPYPADSDLFKDVGADLGELAMGVDNKVGVANGLAQLGSDGKVPTSQLPATSPPDLSAYQTRSEKGAANGYASLASDGKVPTAQLPVVTPPDLSGYQTRAEEGQPNGYASLDSGGKVPSAQLPTGGSFTLPPRLDPVPGPVAGADLDNATAAGWYYVLPTDAHRPPIATYYTLIVQNVTTSVHTRQIAYCYDRDEMFIRRSTGSTWTPWLPMASATQVGVHYTGGLSNDTSYVWTITFPIPFRNIPTMTVCINGWSIDWANVRLATNAVTLTTFDLYVHNVANTNSLEVRWVATQI